MSSRRSTRRADAPSRDEDEEEKHESAEEEAEEEEEETKEEVEEEEEEEAAVEPIPEPEPVAVPAPKEPEKTVEPSPPVVPDEEMDTEAMEQMEVIKNTVPTTELEIALTEHLKRREEHLERLTKEITKLKQFISKRKQTYKRKRKDSSAPTRALSAYNIFVQDKFSRLAKENEQALKSQSSDALLKRVPPSSLVAATGNEWKDLPQDEKAHYEERAREDRKRYEEQMAKYQPPDKQANRKRNKTGYNMFFSAHVLRLKQTDSGVPSERGSVARLVGNAWKSLSSEEKQYYEREADKQNGMNPIEKEEEEEDEDKRAPPDYMHQMQPEMHMQMHQGMVPSQGMPPQHDPRQHAYAPYPHHMAYGQAPYQGQHYEQSQQHAARYHQQRQHGYQGYPPQRHPYDNSGMGM